MNNRFLKYLEIHLVDHCNLNCKGCGHFSTLSPPSFLSLTEFENDLKQLKKHIDRIGQLRLMGGEPLLHPKWIQFFNIARDTYKDSRLSLVTNGILLPKINKNKLVTLKKLNVEVQITFYSELHQDIKEYTRILNSSEITFEIEEKTDFNKHLNLYETHSDRDAIRNCRNKNYCPALKNGKIYQCSGLANFEIFKNHYSLKSFPIASGYNIYNNDANYNSIINFIDTPDPLCCHCFYGEESFPWEISKRNISEWLI
jgi:organic radical activating enzyme